MARRWLLLLGSNLPEDDTLRAAQGRLGTPGSVQALTPIVHLRPASGSGPRYFNALLILDSTLSRDDLRETLRRIELELGRDRSDQARVAIDIDLLGWQQDGAWRADPHALAKGEFSRWPATHLLEMAGVSFGEPTASNQAMDRH